MILCNSKHTQCQDLVSVIWLQRRLAGLVGEMVDCGVRTGNVHGESRASQNIRK